MPWDDGCPLAEHGAPGKRAAPTAAAAFPPPDRASAGHVACCPWVCADPEHLKYVLDHLAELVVKPVGESGGYGILIGPTADRVALDRTREHLRHDPRNFIAQPMVSLSRAPCYDPDTGRLAGRHVDLRPYCLYDGQSVTIIPGGLTRVALRAGSMIVNSSQGGGSKDTWVLAADA